MIWVANFFKKKKKNFQQIFLFQLHLISQARESESHSVVSDSLGPHGLYFPWNSPGQNTGMCSLSLLQGIFPTQGSNPGLPHCRQILYQLSHKGNPRIRKWVAYNFTSGSSWSRNPTRSPSLPTELSGKPRAMEVPYISYSWDLTYGFLFLPLQVYTIFSRLLSQLLSTHLLVNFKFFAKISGFLFSLST